MLELRVAADTKRITALRDAIGRECSRAGAQAEHADLVTHVAEQLVAGPPGARSRRADQRREILVVVTVQSDATMLMVRDPRGGDAGLGTHRRAVLDEHASGWSTMAGREGRTIWAEVRRASRPSPAPTAAAGSGAPAVDAGYGARRAGPETDVRVDERVAGPGGWRLVPAGVRR